MSEHTKGPWKVDEGLGAPEIVGNGRRIARIWYENGSEDREVDANAHLIATAPELLAKCGMALDILLSDGYGESSHPVTALRTVIAKATDR